MVQAMLGLYPYAPLHILMVDPQLPEWLPEFVVRNLKVGRAGVTIRFFRMLNGRSDYEVQDLSGSLHVIRQPSPWSIKSGYAERIRDALGSLVR
jgi:hypothetical protein